MPLTTRCRYRGRMFPVQAQQIKQRRGKVDCPQCGKRFDAIAEPIAFHGDEGELSAGPSFESDCSEPGSTKW